MPGSHTSNDTNGSSVVGPTTRCSTRVTPTSARPATSPTTAAAFRGLIDEAIDRRWRDPGPLHLGQDESTARQQIERRRTEIPQSATGHDRDPTQREQAGDADDREHETDEFDARASVAELDRRIGRDDDHEVRRHPIRPLGSGRLPVGEVTRANEDRLADLVDLKRDREFVGDDVGHRRRRHRLGRQHRRESSGERPHLGDSPRVVLDCLRERRDRLFDHGHRGARPIVGARLGDERYVLGLPPPDAGGEPRLSPALHPIHNDGDAVEADDEIRVGDEEHRPRPGRGHLREARVGLGLQQRLIGERHVVAHTQVLQMTDAWLMLRLEYGRSRWARDGEVDSSDWSRK